MIAFIYVGTSLLTSALAFYLGFNSGSKYVYEIQALILLRFKRNIAELMTEEDFLMTLSKSTKEATELYNGKQSEVEE